MIEEDRLVGLIQDARMVFIAGNGGSASTAEHMTNDLFSKGIAVICLNSNVSIMTMIGNDYGYEYIYSMQLDVYGTPEDLLITISCSGTSPNVVNAQKVAREIGMAVHAFETFTTDRDYEGLEDRHLQLAHRVKKRL